MLHITNITNEQLEKIKNKKIGLLSSKYKTKVNINFYYKLSKMDKIFFQIILQQKIKLKKIISPKQLRDKIP